MTPFDKPFSTKIHPGKKKTFIDECIKTKSFVPSANYSIPGYDWALNKKSDFNKDFRHTLATDIERKAKKELKPEPSTYNPCHRPVENKVLGAFNFKGKREDTSFLAEPALKGHESPRFHDVKHLVTEKKV